MGKCYNPPDPLKHSYTLSQLCLLPTNSELVLKQNTCKYSSPK